jgi:hypothetical protein
MSPPTVSCPSLTDAHSRSRDTDKTGHIPGNPERRDPI